MNPVQVALIGFGQIGRMLFRKWAGGSAVRVVYVADPVFAGQNAFQVAEAGAGTLEINAGIRPGAEVAVIACTSRKEELLPVARQCVECGMSVVTTCEEMFYDKTGEVRLLAEEAEKRGLGILAGGINPGFLMDYLPLVLSGASMNIKSVTVERHQDASSRRSKFQEKIGSGLTLEEFSARFREGKLCHIGLRESALFLADALGWTAGEMHEECEPVTEDGKTAKGIRQILTLLDSEKKERIRLDFLAATCGVESRDRIVIDGEPRIESAISGGVQGDAGTCAVMTALVRRIASCGNAGILTLRDLPPFPGCR